MYVCVYACARVCEIYKIILSMGRFFIVFSFPGQVFGICFPGQVFGEYTSRPLACFFVKQSFSTFSKTAEKSVPKNARKMHTFPKNFTYKTQSWSVHPNRRKKSKIPMEHTVNAMYLIIFQWGKNHEFTKC